MYIQYSLSYLGFVYPALPMKNKYYTFHGSDFLFYTCLLEYTCIHPLLRNTLFIRLWN